MPVDRSGGKLAAKGLRGITCAHEPLAVPTEELDEASRVGQAGPINGSGSSEGVDEAGGGTGGTPKRRQRLSISRRTSHSGSTSPPARLHFIPRLGE